MQIAVFGLGYVGCVSVSCLADGGHDLVGVDVNAVKVDQIRRGLPTIIEPGIEAVMQRAHASGRVTATTDVLEAVQKSQASILCVGTPNDKTGHLDLGAIERVAVSIGEALRGRDEYHVVLIRSTVLPGTNLRVQQWIAESSGKRSGTDFDVVSNPEFLRESSAIADFYDPPVTVIGTESTRAADVARDIYRDVKAPFRRVSIQTAEAIKLVNNSWHALKVCFGNEIGVIAKALEIDSHELMELFCLDHKLNLSPYYLRPGFAYGGSCLPKDLSALTALAHENYIDTPLLRSISRSNEVHVRRLIDQILEHGRRNIGVLGLSFKAGTDDLRNSPIVEVTETLLGRGYPVRIFDRNVHISNLSGTNREYIEAKIPHLAELITDDLDSVVDFADTLIVANREQEFASILPRCTGKSILDLVRMWEPAETSNVDYHGIAW